MRPNSRWPFRGQRVFDLLGDISNPPLHHKPDPGTENDFDPRGGAIALGRANDLYVLRVKIYGSLELGIQSDEFGHPFAPLTSLVSADRGDDHAQACAPSRFPRASAR
jgi:hypothetical protein